MNVLEFNRKHYVMTKVFLKKDFHMSGYIEDKVIQSVQQHHLLKAWKSFSYKVSAS